MNHEQDRSFSDVRPQFQEFLKRYHPHGIAQEAESFVLSQKPTDNLDPVLPQKDVNITALSNVFYMQFFNEYAEREENQGTVKSLRERVNNFVEYFNTWKEHVAVDFYLEYTKSSIQAGDMVTGMSLGRAYEFAMQKYQQMTSFANSQDYSPQETHEYDNRATLWKKRSDIAHWALVQEKKRNNTKR